MEEVGLVFYQTRINSMWYNVFIQQIDYNCIRKVAPRNLVQLNTVKIGYGYKSKSVLKIKKFGGIVTEVIYCTPTFK